MGLKLITIEEHFSEVLKEVCQKKKIEVPPEASMYLIELLKYYLSTQNLFSGSIFFRDTSEKVDLEKSGASVEKNHSLAEMYLTAVQSQTVIRKKQMKFLADKTLYLSGFFSDFLYNKLGDLEYYLDLGAFAYRHLANWSEGESLEVVYNLFSIRFSDFVDILNSISAKCAVQGDKNILRLYDTYLKTGSEYARKSLIELGIFPFPKDQLKNTAS